MPYVEATLKFTGVDHNASLWDTNSDFFMTHANKFNKAVGFANITSCHITLASYHIGIKSYHIISHKTLCMSIIKSFNKNDITLM